MYEYDKIMWCNVTYCAQKNNLPHSSSSYLWCSFIPELLCKYLTVNRFQRRFTPLGIYRVTKTGVFFDIWNNTWPRLVPEPRCYIPRKGGCSATRSQLPRSDVFQTYLWDVRSARWNASRRVDPSPPGRSSRCFHRFFLFLKNAQVTIKQEMETTSVFPVAKIDKCWGRWRVNRVPNGRRTHKRTGPKCWVFMSKHN